jgi:hypothetical protein
VGETDELSQAQVPHNFVNLKKLTSLNEGFVLCGGMAPLFKTAIIISSNSCLGYFSPKLKNFIHSSIYNPYLSDKYYDRNI